MTAELEALIEKGRRSLGAARRLFGEGDYDFAASRAYYAMFYLAEALLLARHLTFSKHSAVIAAFGQHFVKTGLFVSDHHDALRTAFDQRNVGDYAYQAPFPQTTAQTLLTRAEAFVKDAEAYLRREP
jgi:uncharacterized protein (UPF0332 family)